MYALVGCRDCSALWVVEGRPETSQCPRCGSRHQFDRLKQFVSTDDEDHAREVRASILANRQGEGDAFAETDSFAEMEQRLDEAGVDDDEYLEASGVDPDSVAAAGERAEQGATGGSSRRETVLAALESLDAPTEDEVVAYAEERGVPTEYTERALTKLARQGRVAESGGVYRLL